MPAFARSRRRVTRAVLARRRPLAALTAALAVLLAVRANAAPVRIADRDAVRLLRVGDRIDLLAADPRTSTAQLVASSAPVVALPEVAEHQVASASGALVVVAVSPNVARDLAANSGSKLIT